MNDAVATSMRAAKIAERLGKRAVWPGGSAPFSFDYVSAKDPPPPSMAHDPDDVEAEVREIKIGRGCVPSKAKQGSLF